MRYCFLLNMYKIHFYIITNILQTKLYFVIKHFLDFITV